MKKSYQKIIFLLISIVAVSTLSGCTSDKKVKNYLQALLDASYKNDAAIFVDMKLGSEEEAQELYERGIDTGVGVFCSNSACLMRTGNRFVRCIWTCLEKSAIR